MINPEGKETINEEYTLKKEAKQAEEVIIVLINIATTLENLYEPQVNKNQALQEAKIALQVAEEEAKIALQEAEKAETAKIALQEKKHYRRSKKQKKQEKKSHYK